MKGTTRRNYLKQLGTASVGLTFAGTAGAKNNSKESKLDKVYKKALKKREKKGYGAFVKYLEAHGIAGPVKEQTFLIEKESESDGVSTQRYFDYQLNVRLKISYDCNNSDQVWIDCDWSWDKTCTASGHGGEGPNDVVGIYWASTDYSRITNTEYTEDYILLDETHGDYNTSGLAVEYNDYNDWYYSLNDDGCAIGAGSNFGCKAWKEDPSQPPSYRKVKCEYHHTYSGCGINSVTVSSSGVDFDWNCWNDVESFEYQTELGEQDRTSYCRS